MKARPHTVWSSQDYWIARRFAWSIDGEGRERIAWVFKGPWFTWRTKRKLRWRAGRA